MSNYITLPDGTSDLDTITCTIRVSSNNNYLTDTIKLEKIMTEFALHELAKSSVKCVGLLPSMRGGDGGEMGIIMMIIDGVKSSIKYVGLVKALFTGYRLLATRLQNRYTSYVNKRRIAVSVTLGLRYLNKIEVPFGETIGARLFEMDILAEFVVDKLHEEYPHYSYSRATSAWLAKPNFSFHAPIPVNSGRFSIAGFRKKLLKQTMTANTEVRFRKRFGYFHRNVKTLPSD